MRALYEIRSRVKENQAKRRLVGTFFLPSLAAPVIVVANPLAARSDYQESSFVGGPWEVDYRMGALAPFDPALGTLRGAVIQQGISGFIYDGVRTLSAGASGSYQFIVNYRVEYINQETGFDLLGTGTCTSNPIYFQNLPINVYFYNYGIWSAEQTLVVPTTELSLLVNAGASDPGLTIIASWDYNIDVNLTCGSVHPYLSDSEVDFQAESTLTFTTLPEPNSMTIACFGFGSALILSYRRIRNSRPKRERGSVGLLAP